jgi:hypothetical protein
VRNQLWDHKFNGWFDNCLCHVVTEKEWGVKPLAGSARSSTGTSRCWTS